MGNSAFEDMTAVEPEEFGDGYTVFFEGDEAYFDAYEDAKEFVGAMLIGF